jgi:hypothetical protein
MTQLKPVIEQVPFGVHFDYPAVRPPAADPVRAGAA